MNMVKNFPQVNRSPSFGTDTKLDSEIKGGALCDALKLLNIRYFFYFSSFK